MTKTRRSELPRRSQTNGQQRSRIFDLDFLQDFSSYNLDRFGLFGAVVCEKLKGVIMAIKLFKGKNSVHLLPDMLLVIQTKYRSELEADDCPLLELLLYSCIKL